jgi:hypothetical protein
MAKPTVQYISEDRAKQELISDKILKRLGKDISKSYKKEIENILSTKEGSSILNKVAKRSKIQNTVDLIERYEKNSENYKRRLVSSLDYYYNKSNGLKKKIKYVSRNSFD